MTRQRENILQKIDWHIVVIYLFLVFAGWINIYSAVYDETAASIFDITQKYGKQLIWIIAALLLAVFLLITDSDIYYAFSFPIYILVFLMLVAVYFVGPNINGARSWIELGSLRIQPSEFAKLATSLVVAKLLGNGVRITKFTGALIIGTVILIPMALIVLQGDAGSALVFSAFFFVFYREGMPLSILLIGFAVILVFSFSIIWGAHVISTVIITLGLIAFIFYGLQKNHKLPLPVLILVSLTFIIPIVANFVFPEKFNPMIIFMIGFAAVLFPVIIYTYKKRIRTLAVIFMLGLGSVFVSQSVDYVFTNILGDHQQKRIRVFFGLESDPRGSEFNVIQSKIAIGSGDLTGKGFLNGTQTKNDFVPEQSTDFIFCTIGEEWGFLGSCVVLGLFVYLILRIMRDAERQRTNFSRIYGYCVASILFFHVAINVGMTIGLMPVIGIPLPFFSYGGSSLWGFTILLFIFLKLDANREELIQ